MTAAEPDMKAEIEPDHPREWIEFSDPDDSGTLIRADLTWLLSRWSCLFGNGCPGIDAERPDPGCCLHGAYFTDEDDEERVRRAASELTPETWEHARDFDEAVVDDSLAGESGEEEPARKTAVVDGACVFHNRKGFAGGYGCALHAKAVRDGLHPMEYKPEVCWQVPVKRDFSAFERADGSSVDVTWIGEFDRRAWGEGGHDFDWWCTGSPLAHNGASALYRGYETELIELIGKAAYDKLAQLCEEREQAGQVAQHPATRRALQIRPV